MSISGLLIALILPAIIGFAWLNVLWKNSHWAARVGYGYLLGVFIVTGILRLWGGMGLPLGFIPISATIIVLTIPPFIFSVSTRHHYRCKINYTLFDAAWQKILWVILLVILCIRYGGILQEIIFRPLYPWDAWMNWAPKAKTWFELKELVSFVTPYVWSLQESSSNIYTLGNPDASRYPPLVPLIQTWTALGMDSWRDNLVNLPWALCLIALGLSIYGQGRMLGAKPHIALLTVYFILSLPFTGTHTALAGYADIWLASFYTLAGMAFINWSQTRDYRQAILVLIFALACTQTKTPGVVWAAMFIPASLFVFFSKRWSHLIIFILISSFFIFLYLDGFSLNIGNVGNLVIKPEYISIPKLGAFAIEYNNVGAAFFNNDLLRDNWHILGWALLLTTPIFFILSIHYHNLLAPSILVMLGVLFLYLVFFYTKHSLAALDSTTINRATFHMIPLLCFYAISIPVLLQAYERNNDTNADVIP